MFWNAGGQAEFMEGTQQKYWSLSRLTRIDCCINDYLQIYLDYGPTLLNSHHAFCNVPASDRKSKMIQSRIKEFGALFQESYWKLCDPAQRVDKVHVLCLLTTVPRFSCLQIHMIHMARLQWKASLRFA
jgi:hypothetical protein